MSTLAKRVRELREAKGLSQQGLATKARVVVGTIYNIESDKVKPNDATLFMVAAAMGVSVDDLLKPEEE